MFAFVSELGSRSAERQLISSAFKLLPGRLPARTAKFEFQRTERIIALMLDKWERNLIAGEAPAMPNSSPSKLALWMEYSLANFDKFIAGLVHPKP
ncbi:MAG TPA: hypothetical protein VG324_06770 [Blastocatellia bacterium]|nr:hypothetical protein [Blastocatellia bacterium]